MIYLCGPSKGTAKPNRQTIQTKSVRGEIHEKFMFVSETVLCIATSKYFSYISEIMN